MSTPLRNSVQHNRSKSSDDAITSPPMRRNSVTRYKVNQVTPEKTNIDQTKVRNVDSMQVIKLMAHPGDSGKIPDANSPNVTNQATGQQAAGISNNSIITNISASVGQSQIGYLPQVVSDVVKYTDWIMFSKFPKETISVAWSQRVTANEPEKEIEAIYYVVDCWYSPNSQFEGIQGRTTMYIAECLISPQWEENVPELRFLRPVNKHVGNDPKFKPVGSNGLLKVQVNDTMFYGQDKIKDKEPEIGENKHKVRFIIYHPDHWKPKQCHFQIAETKKLLAVAIPGIFNGLVGAGLRIVDPTDLAASAIEGSRIFEKLFEWGKKRLMDKYGDPVRKFDASGTKVSDETSQLELEAAWRKALEGHFRDSNLKEEVKGFCAKYFFACGGESKT